MTERENGVLYRLESSVENKDFIEIRMVSEWFEFVVFIQVFKDSVSAELLFFYSEFSVRMVLYNTVCVYNNYVRENTYWSSSVSGI